MRLTITGKIDDELSENILKNIWSMLKQVGVKEIDIQEEGSSNFIQLKNDVLNNKQLWQKLREIEDEDSD